MMTTAEAQTFRQALRLYERGAFFECHDMLEPLWLADRTGFRLFYQGLIQLAAAFVHWQRGEMRGILKLLQASRAKLSQFPPDTAGLDLPLLLADVAAAERYFASPDATPAGFAASRLPRLRRLPVHVGTMP
jgi:predicted metal-dependent hydrolase